MTDKHPSILKIIWIDYVAFLSTALCLMAIGLYVYDRFFKGNISQSFAWIALGIFLLGLFGLAWRYIYIVSLFNSGLEVRATVSDAGFFRDRGSIKYIYPYEGKRYASHMTVMKNKLTTCYQIGEEIEVIVDRENPKKTLIKDLFI
jgi:cell division protein FtsW (lipid II flippase)